MSSSRQTCEKAGPGSAKTKSSKVPERAQSGSVVWCLTVTVSRVKCQAGKRTIGVTPGPAGFPVAVAGIKSKSPTTSRATRTGSARLDPPKPFIQASQTIPAAREALTLGWIGIVLKTGRGEANSVGVQHLPRPLTGPVARCGLGLEAQHAQNPLRDADRFALLGCPSGPSRQCGRARTGYGVGRCRATTVAEPCGSAGCETLIRTRVLNAPLGAWRRGSDAAAERVDAGQFRLPRASSCHTARSPASSAYHGDPESPAGGGHPPGRRLAPRDLREWGFVAFASGGSSCRGHRRPVRRRQLHCLDGHEGRVSAVTVSLAGTVISE